MDWLLIAMVVGVGAFGYGLLHYARGKPSESASQPLEESPPKLPELLRKWKTVADQRGGTLRWIPAIGANVPGELPVLDFELHGMPVHARLDVVRDGPYAGRLCTLFEARFQWGPSPRLRITPEGLGTRVSEFFGNPDVRLGRAAFDKVFAIEAERPELAPVMIPVPVGEQLVELGGGHLEIEGSKVKLILGQLILGPDYLDGWLDLLIQLASTDPLGIGALVGVGADKPRDGACLARLPVGAITVDAGPVERSGVLGTEISVASRAAGNWSVELGTGAALPEQLPPAAVQCVPEVGEASLDSKDGTVTLWWCSIQRDPARLQAGAALVAACTAGPSLGVYR